MQAGSETVRKITVPADVSKQRKALQEWAQGTLSDGYLKEQHYSAMRGEMREFTQNLLNVQSVQSNARHEGPRPAPPSSPQNNHQHKMPRTLTVFMGVFGFPTLQARSQITQIIKIQSEHSQSLGLLPSPIHGNIQTIGTRLPSTNVQRSSWPLTATSDQAGRQGALGALTVISISIVILSIRAGLKLLLCSASASLRR